MIDADDDIDTRETADKRRHRPWAVFDRSLSLCPNHGSYSIIPIAFFIYFIGYVFVDQQILSCMRGIFAFRRHRKYWSRFDKISRS